MIIVNTQEVTPLAQNCRILFDDESREIVVIDPGGDIQKIESILSEYQYIKVSILLTHAHIDHAGGVSELLGSLSRGHDEIPLLYHDESTPLCSSIETQAMMFGLGPSFKNVPQASSYLEEGKDFRIGSQGFKILYTPGHAPGHISLFYEGANALHILRDHSGKVQLEETLSVPWLIAGDALFRESIGRTDLPGGNHELLLSSIREKLYSLPDNTRVMPGHGPDTTIGHEKKSNPFVRVS